MSLNNLIKQSSQNQQSIISQLQRKVKQQKEKSFFQKQSSVQFLTVIFGSLFIFFFIKLCCKNRTGGPRIISKGGTSQNKTGSTRTGSRRTNHSYGLNSKQNKSSLANFSSSSSNESEDQNQIN